MDLKKTVSKLPTTSGIYIYRSEKGKIVYIGKAINLRARVRSYFQDSPQEPKTQELVHNIAKIEYMKTGSEIEALLLEAELIKRYKPRYNVIWKDDKNYIYIKITNEDYPQVSLVRQIVDDKAKYIGPFVSAGAVRGLVRYIRKIFMFRHCEYDLNDIKGMDSRLRGNDRGRKVCLQYSIGNCSGPCEKYITKAEYNKNIRQMVKLFQGKTKEIEREFTREMKTVAKNEDFEKAALYRNRLMWLKKIKTIELGEEERDLKRDKALVGLRDALNLGVMPKRIECYDISNIFGKAAVGSMVVFIDGIPEKNHYRRFEIKTVDKISDTDMIREVLSRRFKKFGNLTKPDESFSQIPDLIIIDGGKGQLSAAEKALDKHGLNLNLVSLAKQREEIFRRNPETGEFYKTMLDEGSESLYLVQRIRDEAHRFAITYHRSKRGKEMAVSNLDVVDGIGPKTKKVLLKNFETVENVRNASVEDLAKVVGDKLAKKIKENL